MKKCKESKQIKEIKNLILNCFYVNPDNSQNAKVFSWQDIEGKWFSRLNLSVRALDGSGIVTNYSKYANLKGCSSEFLSLKKLLSTMTKQLDMFEKHLDKEFKAINKKIDQIEELNTEIYNYL